MNNTIKHAYLLLLLAPCLVGCNLDNDYRHKAPDGIYFDYMADTSRRHITYSFALSPELVEDTVWLPVTLSGERLPHDRTFTIEITPAGTTAQEGTHYKRLAGDHTLPAGEGAWQLPVILYNTDPAMEEKTLTLAFRLVASADFEVPYSYLSDMRISFSNRLEKPGWWNYWGELGVYSRTRHYLFIVGSGTTELSNPSKESEKTMQSLAYIRTFKAFIMDPFGWVESHPDYAIVQVADENYEGNPVPTYHFYLKDKPERTYKLQKIQINALPNAATNVFFDENGLMIFYTS